MIVLIVRMSIIALAATLIAFTAAIIIGDVVQVYYWHGVYVDWVPYYIA